MINMCSKSRVKQYWELIQWFCAQKQRKSVKIIKSICMNEKNNEKLLFGSHHPQCFPQGRKGANDWENLREIKGSYDLEWVRILRNDFEWILNPEGVVGDRILFLPTRIWGVRQPKCIFHCSPLTAHKWLPIIHITHKVKNNDKLINIWKMTKNKK